MFKEITIRDCFPVLFENTEGEKIENINIFSLIAKKQILELIASPEMWSWKWLSLVTKSLLKSNNGW